MIYLTKENTYTSPVRKLSLLEKKCPAIAFYFQMLSVVFNSARLARQGKYDGEQWALHSYKTIKALESVGVRFHVDNLKAVMDLDTPAVFVANHMSTLETFALPVMIQPFREVTYVVKDSLVRYPVFKHVMRARNPIVVTRDNPRQDFKIVMEQGIEKLKNGSSVIIFPQKTRRLIFEPAQFNSIGIKLAAKADVPVVPVAVQTYAWGNGKVIKDFGKIDPSEPAIFEFGNPLQVKGKGRETHKQVIEFISTRLRNWQKKRPKESIPPGI